MKLTLFYLLLAIHKPMKVSRGEWVLANLHVSGYFRVNYDLGNWERLLSQLESNHQVLHENYEKGQS